MLDVIYALGGAAVGYLIASIQHLVADSGHRKERMLLFEKGLTQGDGARLYNLRVADGVTKDSRTITNAVEKEVEARAEFKLVQSEESGAPWATHPSYAGCDVTFDSDRGVVAISNEGASDGPDYWEEPFDKFMSQFHPDPEIQE